MDGLGMGMAQPCCYEIIGDVHSFLTKLIARTEVGDTTAP